ncbi:MAG: hypothetical protein WA433_03945 [Desulfobaccales bacterium]
MKEKFDAMKDSGPPAFSPSVDLLMVGVLSAVVFFLAHLNAWSNPYVINDDVRQQIFWMQQWLDPQLFRGDLLADYARHYVPWGVQGLYWLAAWVTNPISFSKFLPGLLFIFLALCLYRLGLGIGGRGLAWTMVAVYWFMPFFLDNLAGGLARAFAAPLLAFFWLCWQEERPWGMGAALLLQALFIPYIFITSALAVALAWLAGRWGSLRPPPFPAQRAHFFLLAAGAALVALMNYSFDASGFGPLVSYAEMVNRPEFYAGGRYAILPVPSIFWELINPWEWIAPFRDLGLLAGIATCVVLAGATLWGLTRVALRALAPRLQPLGYLLLAGLAVYCLARIFLLKLFIPDRYLIYILNLAYCLILALGLNALLKVEQWPRTLAVLVLAAAVALGVWRLWNVGLKDFAVYRPVYAALAATPKDAIIAGHPNLMDNVPTFARRRVLVTYKLAHPWSKGLWQKIEPRLEDLFAAYYAADPQEVIAFCRKYQVSFLVVDDRHFTPEFLAGGRFFVPMVKRVPKYFGKTLEDRVDCPFFAPFDAEIQRLTKGRYEFALLSSPLFPAVVLDKHLRLLDMRSFLR